MIQDFEYTKAEEMKTVAGMRSKLDLCLLDYDEESCLRALFDHSYFWSK